MSQYLWIFFQTQKMHLEFIWATLCSDANYWNHIIAIHDLLNCHLKISPLQVPSPWSFPYTFEDKQYKSLFHIHVKKSNISPVSRIISNFLEHARNQILGSFSCLLIRSQCLLQPCLDEFLCQENWSIFSRMQSKHVSFLQLFPNPVAFLVMALSTSRKRNENCHFVKAFATIKTSSSFLTRFPRGGWYYWRFQCFDQFPKFLRCPAYSFAPFCWLLILKLHWKLSLLYNLYEAILLQKIF